MPESRNSSLGRRASAGAAWMVMLRVADRLVGIFSLAVLARLLVPQDFGLVSFAMLVAGLLELVSQFGVDVALIRDQQASRGHYDTAWTINVIKGAVLAVALLLLARPAANFFGSPDLEAVIHLIALLPLITGFENVGIIHFRKDLQFHRQFLFVLSARVAATLVTISLAWFWRSHWALVGGILARGAFRVLLSYWMHGYRPRFSLERLNDIFDFSKWVFLQSLIHGLNERVPALTVGRIAGAEALAFFSVGKQIGDLATSELRAPIRQALFPAFAKLATSRGELARGFRDSLALLLLVSLPVPVGIGLTATHIVRLFLGPTWMEVVPILQVLSLLGAIATLGTSSHLVYWAINRPGLTAGLSALRLTLLAPLAVWLVAGHGAIGAAWALTFSLVVVIVVDYVIIVRVLEVPLGDLLFRTWRIFAATALMAATVAATIWELGRPEDVASVVAIQLAVCVLVGAATYLAVLWALWRLCGRCNGPEKQMLNLLGERLGRSPSTGAATPVQHGDG